MSWLNDVCKAVNYDEMRITEKRLHCLFYNLLNILIFKYFYFFRLAVGVGNGQYELYKENSNMDMGRAVGGVFVTKNLTGPHYEIVGQACLANIHSGKTNIETVDFNILGAEAKAEIGYEDI